MKKIILLPELGFIKYKIDQIKVIVIQNTTSIYYQLLQKKRDKREEMK